jgi:putative hydrolase of the HAD superfamily
VTLPIRAVLFDADGVIQRGDGAWPDVLAPLISPEQDLAAFSAAVLAAERPCLAGERDFAIEMQRLLTQWGSARPLDDALSIWRRLIVDAPMLATIGELRRAGIRCYLATNQHQHRAAYMARELGYSQLFDDGFYSCHVGHAKPSRAYFEYIVAALRMAPAEIVFFDDQPANAAAARAVGINGVHFPPNAGRATLLRLLEAFDVRINAQE